MLFILLTSNIIIQGITTMYKRIICFFLVVVLTISMFSFAASAEDHQHTFGEVENTIDLSGATMPNGDSLPLGLSITKSPCSTPGVDCDQVRYSWDFFGRKGSFVDDKNLPVAQVILHWYKWNEEFYGKNVGFDKLDATNGGANIPAAGGRNPKGYGDDGKANVTSTGVEVLWVEPFGLSGSPNGFSKTVPSSLIAGNSGSATRYFGYNSVQVVYYFTAPVTGLYYVGSAGSPYDLGTFNYFINNVWVRLDLTSKMSSPYTYSGTFDKGDSIYFYAPSVYAQNASYKPYKFYLNNIPIYIEPLGDSSITTVNNITITNNNYSQTWNGNIYTDNSTNLTYIYPQYTTINESGDTVTNISNNPIIYNNETKQYYTYDQTTKNYYYIYYGSDSPTPSPTPDPGTDPTPTPGGGSSGGDDGSGSGGSSGSSGSSWWEKLLDKLGSALIDGLLGAISAVLKLIFKLLSTILGWIIWLVSQVLTLFPFLPPGLGALLIGGVVVCFVIGIIKFIRG